MIILLEKNTEMEGRKFVRKFENEVNYLEKRVDDLTL